MKLPSVTKILETTMSPEKRAKLEAWRDRVGHEEAERIREAAFLRGRTIDDQVEIFAHTRECEDARIAAYLSGFVFVARELPVVSDMYGYQGRLDAVLRANNMNVLVDFKGSTRWRRKEYLSDYRLQLGAYFGACRETGMNIDAACVVLFIDGKDQPQLYWQQLHELDEAHAMFIEKVKEFKVLTCTNS